MTDLGSTARFSRRYRALPLHPTQQTNIGSIGTSESCQFETGNRSKANGYSITSSARPSNISDTVMPAPWRFIPRGAAA